MRQYFAYGSNLWLEQMRVRSPEHLVVGPGILMGYRLIIITSRGYANVVGSDSDSVLGTIYSISPLDEERLDLCEGVSDGHYRKEVLSVESERGAIDCLVYVDPVAEQGDPLEEYAERLRKGASDAQLPETYLERYLWHLATGSQAA